MKIALYIESGREQIVLTPEIDMEKKLLELLHNNKRVMSVRRGQFYACQGGWSRQGTGNESTMLVLEEPTPTPLPPEVDLPTMAYQTHPGNLGKQWDGSDIT